MDLTGRSAIITGASRGLGRAIATAIVRAGASVLLSARDGPALRGMEAVCNRHGTSAGQKLYSVNRSSDDRFGTLIVAKI